MQFLSRIFPCIVAFSALAVLPIHGLDPKKVVVAFSHGMVDTGKQAYNYAGERAIIQEPIQTFTYPHAQGMLARFMRINPWQTDLGQKHDVRCFDTNFHQAASKGDAVVAMGVSLGGAVVINWAGLMGKFKNLVNKYNPALYAKLETSIPALAHYKKLKVVIAESSPHSLTGMITDQVPNACLKTTIKKIIKVTRGRFPFFPFSQYGLDGLKPVDMIKHVDKPLLLICSQKDSVVPSNSTLKLQCALKNSDNRDTYLLKLNQGRHARLLSGPEGHIYQKTVHAFYKKYDLPHDPVLAEQGKTFLEEAVINKYSPQTING